MNVIKLKKKLQWRNYKIYKEHVSKFPFSNFEGLWVKRNIIYTPNRKYRVMPIAKISVPWDLKHFSDYIYIDKFLKGIIIYY